MDILLIVGVVAVPFALFWFAGRGIKPSTDGQQANVRELLESDRINLP